MAEVNRSSGAGASAVDASARRKLVLIYDADRTIVGELKYVIGHHLLGTVSCALCEISHGPLRQKEAWKAWVERAEALGLELSIIHRNQMAGPVREFVNGRLACVIEQLGDAAGSERFRMLLNPDQLGACNGQVDAFESALTNALGYGLAT